MRAQRGLLLLPIVGGGDPECPGDKSSPAPLSIAVRPAMNLFSHSNELLGQQGMTAVLDAEVWPLPVGWCRPPLRLE